MKLLPCSMERSGASASTAMDRTMVPHAHREGHLLFHVQGGPGEVYVDGCAIPLGPGQAVAVNPWQTHYYSQPVPGGQTLVLVLYIRPTWFWKRDRQSGRRRCDLGARPFEVSDVLGRLIDVSAMLDRDQDDPAINDWLLTLDRILLRPVLARQRCRRALRERS